MTAGASDLQQSPAGFGGKPTPSIPEPGNGVVPTASTDAPLSAQDLPPSEPGSEGGDDLELHEEDIAFLQSEPVQRWLSQNVPQGFVPEQRLKESIAELQSVKDREVHSAREQAKRFEGELEQTRTQAQALVHALYQAWKDAGIDESSDDWKQRQAGLRQYLNNLSNQAQVERQKNTQMLTQFADTQEQEIGWQLQLAGVSPDIHPNVQRLLQVHREKIVNNEYESMSAAETAAKNIVQYAVQIRNAMGQGGQQNGNGQQPQVQPLAQATQPPQQQAQPRPNPGPARLPRRGGGSSNLSMDDRFDQAYNDLLARYGNDPFKVPPDEVERIWIQAYSGTVGV